MQYGINSAGMIKLDRVFLDTHNPRHKPFTGEPETIAYLCKNEQVLSLAEDIAKHGLNPLELFALISDDGGNTYYVAEGNRRLCALLLLNDPARAPFELQKRFTKAAEKWTNVAEIFAVVFKNREEVSLWLDRIHAGPDNGRGRRSWTAEQKSRNTGYSKNDLAQAVLDLAQSLGFITEDERRGRISTVQKYLANPDLREGIGLVGTDPENLLTNLPDEDVSKTFGRFIRDVAERKIDTRSGQKAEKIVEYAEVLKSTTPITGAKTEPHPFKIKPLKPTKPRRTKPSFPKKPETIFHSQELEAAIKAIPSFKLEHLYFSLTSINLNAHTPLLSIAAWAIIECLTRANGNTTAFDQFLSGQRLDSMGFKKGDTTQKSMIQAIRRIAENGNTTKHNERAADFNSEQLSNDIEVLTPLLIKLAEGAK